MKCAKSLMGFQSFDAGMEFKVLGKPQLITLTDVICSQTPLRSIVLVSFLVMQKVLYFMMIAQVSGKCYVIFPVFWNCSQYFFKSFLGLYFFINGDYVLSNDIHETVCIYNNPLLIFPEKGILRHQNIRPLHAEIPAPELSDA